MVELVQEEVHTTFQELGVCDELLDSCKRLNYTKPTPIQKESLPYTLNDRDIIALAETGSGKTLAFAIPIIQKLLNSPQPYFAMVLSPTRELCIQIGEHFEALGVSVGLKTVTLVGGLDPMMQAIALSKKPHIIIGSPGRILYHLQNTKGFSVKNMQFLVFDEADKLLNQDFEREINQILEILPKTRQTFLFSATMTNKVSKLQKVSLKNPVKVEVSSKYQTVATLTQNYLFLPAKFKDVYLIFLLNEFSGNSTIIFANTCMGAIRICLMIRNLGFQSVTIHGQMSQTKRIGALSKFKAGERKILIATDVASRGLDIPNVDLVINYDIPVNAKDYIHRVGRTARAGKAGKALSIVTQYDIEPYQKIEHLINKKLEVYKTEENEVMIFQERVQEAQRIANQEIKSLLEERNKKMNDEEDDDEADVRHGQKKKVLMKKRIKKFKDKKLKKKTKIDI